MSSAQKRLASLIPPLPEYVVKELDKYVVGQDDAKRCLAIAMRSRYRRRMLRNSRMRDEVMHRNVLVIGQTGVGKTEMIRRIAMIHGDVPFIKVEATKFTEIGYVGRDVESIVRDLFEITFRKLRAKEIKKRISYATKEAYNIILDSIMETYGKDSSEAREKVMKKLKNNEMNDFLIELEVSNEDYNQLSFDLPNDTVGLISANDIISKISGELNRPIRKIKVIDALHMLQDEECSRSINESKIAQETAKLIENDGIVFIDEIDKLISFANSNSRGEISREGVQRDLLALIGGTDVQIRNVIVNTSHILFIAAGAFHNVSVTDMLPELQGRLPVRVTMQRLSEMDLLKILQIPRYNIIKQYQAMLSVDGIKIRFTNDGLLAIARAANYLNENSENLGARRLHAVIDRVLENVSFKCKKGTILINAKYVSQQLKVMLENNMQKKENYII